MTAKDDRITDAHAEPPGLTNAGLPELIADSWEGSIQVASALALDRERLFAVR